MFDEFRSQTATLVRPVGAERTRARLRTRRRNRGALFGALAVLVVAISVAAGAGLTGNRPGPATNSAAPVPSPSGSTIYFVGPGEKTEPSTTAPIGGITEKDLYSATLDLPAWPAGHCAGGPVPFQDGDTQDNRGALWIAGVAYADVDRDGRAETFARIFCMGDPGQEESQVLAFTPAEGGGIRTIGPVLQQTGGVVAICGIRAGANGAIQVETADFPVPWHCADPTSADQRYVTRQWLTFTWNGSGFVQQDAPAPPVNPYATDLRLTSSKLVLTRQKNGHYTGSMTLTVRNTGVSAIPYRTQTVISTGMRLVDPPPGCAVSPSGGGMEDVNCTGSRLAGGATRTLTLKIDSPRRYELTYVPDTNVLPAKGYNDPNQANDRAALTIEFRD
ncbi:hypothetical protein GCM10010168_55700 [Actinoplanes ianthinogenes]|uniref:CARDB domain-containing protein n=1 Tax=Actinoplanes ianthinogenes TaxID=122358 RepID=A0ABM7LQ79_9ACTN|nr:hypothetical protein Aiant_20880 [Actinoplanes ianthinogenes]GGR30163.1 hypothetical protein GCM10010168_55700 [Actinoplanes ianthinogenes]